MCCQTLTAKTSSTRSMGNYLKLRNETAPFFLNPNITILAASFFSPKKKNQLTEANTHLTFQKVK